MSNWIKKNEIILTSGLFPGAVVALASLAVVYSIWVSSAVCVGSFVVVNAFILLIELKKGRLWAASGKSEKSNVHQGKAR